MFRKNNTPAQPTEMQRVAAAVASESRSYTDPEAEYATAVQFRQQRREGVARRSYGQEAQAA
jgi:hypothetical protein